MIDQQRAAFGFYGIYRTIRVLEPALFYVGMQIRTGSSLRPVPTWKRFRTWIARVVLGRVPLVTVVKAISYEHSWIAVADEPETVTLEW